MTERKSLFVVELTTAPPPDPTELEQLQRAWPGDWTREGLWWSKGSGHKCVIAQCNDGEWVAMWQWHWADKAIRARGPDIALVRKDIRRQVRDIRFVLDAAMGGAL